MAKISSVKLDMDKVEKGVWHDYAEGIRLCIASISNNEYKKARDKLLASHLRQIRARTLTSDEVLDILKPAVAKHLLVNWSSIEDETGKTIPYSYEKALEFFNDPALSDFYSFVLDTAGENSAYRQELIEDAEKNLSNASSGI